MNSDRPEGIRGGITPSARKSIHYYRGTQLWTNDNMVTYGANGADGGSSSSDNQGADEVDNIMSKMSRETSPLSIKKRKIKRTYSNSQEEENTDDTYVLSKSLPASLPSYSCYSDDSNLEDQNYSASFNRSRRVENDSYPVNRSNSRNLEGFLNRRGLVDTSREEDQLQSQTTRILFFTLVIVIVAALYTKFPSLLTHNVQEKSTQTVNHDKTIFENNMNNLQEKYNIDDNSILKLKTGISTIFSRMDTGSFMFVYNSRTSSFNLIRFEKFIDEVAFTAARYLRNDISSIQHTVVSSSSLDMQEHGELISRYRDDVHRSGVLLVKEIEGVPSNLAMAFHYYCDEYDPLVKRSAIFFTLNMANCSSSDQKSTHDFIEKCLSRKWKTVRPENMRPLLTRVVDIIIDVTAVF